MEVEAALFTLLLLLGSQGGRWMLGAVPVVSQDCIDYIDVSVNPVPVDVDNKTVWTCLDPDNYSWISGNIVHYSQCQESGQLEEGLTCVPNISPVTPCSDSTLPQPGNVSTTELVPGLAKYFTCEGGNTWVSRISTTRVTQCINGQWTQVMDECSEACLEPRDCSEISELGIHVSALYTIVPSIEADATTIEVWCDLSPEPATSGWTRIAIRDEKDHDRNLPINRQRKGFGQPTVDSGVLPYFIGTNHLRDLSVESGGSSNRIFVLEVLATKKDGSGDISASSEVKVVTDGVTFRLYIQNKPNYYDNAGSVMQPHDGKNFRFNDESWWWNAHNDIGGIKMDGDHVKFSNHDHHTIQRIVARIRPLSFDQKVSCPVMFGHMRSNTWLPLLPPRQPGQVLPYRCLDADKGFRTGPGTRLNERPTEGNVTCVRQQNGTLAWEFPWPDYQFKEKFCELVCPDNYTYTNNLIHCIKFSKEVSGYGGISSASLRCQEEGAGLAFLWDTVTLPPNIKEDVYFYTAFVFGNDDYPLDFTPSCAANEECELSLENNCMAVKLSNGSLQYRAQSCYRNDTYYACITPVHCPGDYWPYNKLCYKMAGSINDDDDFIQTMAICVEEGGGLAYPEDWDVLNQFSQWVITHRTDNYWKKIQLGLNDRFNDSTGNGVYSPNQTLLTSVFSGEGPYRLLHMPTTEIEPFQITREQNDPLTYVHYAACQLFAFSGCPEITTPSANMTYINSTGTVNYGSWIEYSCLPGHFVDGNRPEVEQTAVCNGMLGGWVVAQEYKPFLPCVPVEVCNDTILLSSVSLLINVTLGSYHRYLNGTLNLTCPDGMAWSPNLTMQNLTCTQIGGDDYNYLPSPEPCNVCDDPPSIDPNITTSNYTSNLTYFVGDTLELTCLPGHVVNLQSDNQTSINCTLSGWTNPQLCYEACTAPPPSVGTNMTQPNITSIEIGTLLIYNCSQGTHHVQSFPVVAESVMVECLDNGTWDPIFTSMDCDILCFDKPPSPPTTFPSLAIPPDSDWDNVTRTVHTLINFTCPNDTVLPDLNTSVVVSCEESGNWSAVNTLLLCRRVTSGKPPVLPGSIIEGPSPPYWEGDTFNYTCPPLLLSPTNTNLTTIIFNGTHWELEELDFQCLNVCWSDPPSVLPPTNTSWDENARVVGTEVMYWCPTDHFFPDLTYAITMTCNETSLNWTLTNANSINNTWINNTITFNETQVNSSSLECRILALDDPPFPEGSVYDGTPAPYWKGDILNYTCPPHLLSPSGTNHTSVLFNGTDWVMDDPEFRCLNVCSSEVPPSPPRVGMNLTGEILVEGVIAMYTCPVGFLNHTNTFNVTCGDAGWIPASLPPCPMCSTSPPRSQGGWKEYNGMDGFGAIAFYHCPYGFPDGRTIVNSTCEESGNWTVTDIPVCQGK
ncbi:hypothetical protein Pcinc_018623 [Petrolisthes cinctipes]|uniref:Sushi domain-containing protein n=1 Tax=Petrolisthes cinctipes TaxID=88211 RepID=A0AAE1FLT2_PETCI|nr:hypothetical protein Pcinc_018623 [Petrolisthes cinctipes]